MYPPRGSRVLLGWRDAEHRSTPTGWACQALSTAFCGLTTYVCWKHTVNMHEAYIFAALAALIGLLGGLMQPHIEAILEFLPAFPQKFCTNLKNNLTAVRAHRNVRGTTHENFHGSASSGKARSSAQRAFPAGLRQGSRHQSRIPAGSHQRHAHARAEGSGVSRPASGDHPQEQNSVISVNVSCSNSASYVAASDKRQVLRKVPFHFRNKLHFSGPSSPLLPNLVRLVWERIGEMVARGAAKVRRIIAYLFEAEKRESNPWLRDDLRVARSTLQYAHQGDPDPSRIAFVSYFGTQPEKAITYWQERERQTQAYLNPKKPAQSVEVEKAREKAASSGS